MTIDSAYAEQVFDKKESLTYTFQHEMAVTGNPFDASAINVYTIDVDGLYTGPLELGSYSVDLNPYRQPVASGGTITFTGELDASVVAISIRRKTAITDVQDYPSGEPFNAESFEFQADKLTLILQEINDVFCDCRGGSSLPAATFCNTYACDAYENSLIASGADNVWLMNQGTGGITDGSLVESEKTESSISMEVGNSISSTTNPGILPDGCPGEFRYDIGSYSGGSNRLEIFGAGSTLAEPFLALTFLVLNLGTATASSTIVYNRLSSNGGVTFSYQTNGIDLDIQIAGMKYNTGGGSFTYTVDNFWTGFPFVATFIFQDGDVRVYKDWELLLDETPTLSINTGQGELIENHIRWMDLSHCAVWGSAPSSEDIANLKLGFERNASTYVDPNPDCIPPE